MTTQPLLVAAGALGAIAAIYYYWANRSRASKKWTPEHRSADVINPLPSLRHENILTTVGCTPIIKLQKLAPPGVNIYVKFEAMNPMGSIKDRLAVGAIEWAEQHGKLKPGQTVIEGTSGNTGIGLAMVCAVKGYPLVIVMSEGFSIERRKILRHLGAKVLLTNPAHKGNAMFQTIDFLVKKYGWFPVTQFETEANAWIHTKTTGPEIMQAMRGLSIDYFVTATGTGGTLKGVGGYLRKHSPRTKIVVTEPDTAPIIQSDVGSTYDADGIPHESHPFFRAHLFQGWTPDAITPIVQSAKDSKLIDELISVDGHEGMATARALAQKEGIFTGTSGGGVVLGALKKAKTVPPGTTLLAIVPDTGERYLSTPLFADIPADMTAEEKALKDECPPTYALPQPLPEADDKSRAFVKDAIKSDKLVYFAFNDCEFCWTLKKLLDAIGVKATTIAFDTPEYAKGNFGNKIRAALQEHTGVKTFPQMFVNGKFFGGAVDACIGWNKGELQSMLLQAGLVSTRANDKDWNGFEGDPFEFLPKWMSFNPKRTL